MLKQFNLHINNILKINLLKLSFILHSIPLTAAMVNKQYNKIV